MLTLPGRTGSRFCDGVSRREFLTIGGLTLGGMSLSLPSLARAELAAGLRATGKSVVNIYLAGGPTHMDTFDLKPKAPKEYRGEFNPIATNAPGLEICELMPELASVGDKFSVVRSLTGLKNEHRSHQSDSGWPGNSLENMGGRPGIGSVMSKVFGPARDTERGTAPTAVDLNGWTRPGFLGQTHAAYRPDGTGRANLKLNRSVSVDRLSSRSELLTGLDRMKREADASGMMSAMDSFSERAFGLITSGHMADALDYKQESPERLSRYGDPTYRSASQFLQARRLIEAGVRCVSLSIGGWDTHRKNFDAMRKNLPPLSKALAALIADLDETGRLDDTIIMMSGEFGRTPRINGNAGRDHWSRSGFFFLAGGGLNHGQAIGETNARGEEPQDRPVHLQHVFHTLYHVLGIDADTVTLTDPNGRPQYLVEHRELIHELL